MTQHYSRATVSVQAFCRKCQRRTMHRVDHVGSNAGGKKGPCLECIKKLESLHSVPKPEPEKQEELFG